MRTLDTTDLQRLMDAPKRRSRTVHDCAIRGDVITVDHLYHDAGSLKAHVCCLEEAWQRHEAVAAEMVKNLRRPRRIRKGAR